MPIYEYRCSACGKRSSALLSSYSSPDPACPHCGKPEVQRLVSTFATLRSDGGGDGFGDGDFGDEHGHSHAHDHGDGDGDDDFGGFDGGDDDF